MVNRRTTSYLLAIQSMHTDLKRVVLLEAFHITLISDSIESNQKNTRINTFLNMKKSRLYSLQIV